MTLSIIFFPSKALILCISSFLHNNNNNNDNDNDDDDDDENNNDNNNNVVNSEQNYFGWSMNKMHEH